LFDGLFRAVSGDRADMPEEAGLMTGFIEASRGAASFRDALQAALESLRRGAGAQSAMLLEGVSAEEFRSTTVAPDPQAPSCSIPRQGLLANRLRFHSAPLPIAVEDYDVWKRWAAEHNSAHLPEIESLRSAGARLAVPLRTNKEMLGVVLLGSPEAGPAYNHSATRLLRDCANHFALMLENARLTERIVEHERLQRDLALAAEVQKRLLPRQSLETAVVALAAVSLPARSVGGDYYDFLDLPGQRTAIALADVAGKGVAAALIMSVVQASLRVITSEPDISLPQLAAKLNHFLYRSTGSNSYATFFYAQLDEGKRELRYVNAGHNPPFLLRAGPSASVEELLTGGTIIGMFPQARYEEGAVELRTGDVLAVFTDGVPEAQNPAEEEFGEERLKELLASVVHLPVEEMSLRISRELKDWIRDAAQYDDLTFVLMKVK
jgi:sigma-B regulation protein RsbU (phosphoserine phosphatase)